MKDEGFMMLDALLAMLIFSIIIGVLVPALMMIRTTVTLAEEKLDFSRSLYIELLNHDAPDNFTHDDYILKGDSICAKKNETLCLRVR
ncbi:type II secretion system protein [Salinicoccus carnicancri]|uniref:type II secretion system protein n=1 Tax=Salinicoccus carnicancri TaxID=558170 RepID=UPI0002FFF4D4|nr:type II secretion system protein [Salinicoccus carnicancri]